MAGRPSILLSLTLVVGLASQALASPPPDPTTAPSVSATVAATPNPTAEPTVAATPTVPAPAMNPQAGSTPERCLPPGRNPTLPWPGCVGQTGSSAKTNARGIVPAAPARVAPAAAPLASRCVSVSGGSCSIKGKVTKAGGVGLSGIDVYASVDSSSNGYYNSASTAADGTYSVTVDPGTYTLNFSDYSDTYGNGYYSTGGFTYSSSGASPVAVSSADVTGKNVTLPLAVHIKGKVTKAGGVGLSRIAVLVNFSSNGIYNYAYSAADGTYSVAVAPGGTYTLFFRDYSGIYGSGYYSTGGFTYSSSGASPVTVSSADVTGKNVTLPLAPAASTYHALAPARVLDTRPTIGVVVNMGLTGVFKAGMVRTFHVGGARYVGGGTTVAVPTNATAVTGNLTIVGQTATGLVALGPTMTASGEVTTINFVKGDVRANNVTLGLAPDGTLSAVFRSSAGATVQLIFDVTGYFTPDPSGATYHSLAPGRVLDSRKTGGAVVNIGLTGKFANKVVRTFNVASVKGLGWSSALVPAGATAVSGNVTITNATSAGFLSIGPTMVAVPKTSTLNVLAGANVANGVTVTLNAGKLSAVWDGTNGSSADVVFDVTGYFTTGPGGLSYYPIAPVRVLNSATSKGLPGVFATGIPRSLGLAGVGAIPANAAGISGNLTLVNPSSVGFGSVAPSIVGIPKSSTLNSNAHVTVANGFDVALAAGKVSIIWVGTKSSTANYSLDVTGYWR